MTVPVKIYEAFSAATRNVRLFVAGFGSQTGTEFEESRVSAASAIQGAAVGWGYHVEATGCDDAPPAKWENLTRSRIHQ